MVGLHSTVGTLVLVGFLLLTVLNALSIGGRSFSFLKPLSFAAAGLLGLQYVLGFGLLSGDSQQKASHYVLALAALVTVGLDHGMANTKEDPKQRARLSTVFNLLTFALVLGAYMVAESN